MSVPLTMTVVLAKCEGVKAIYHRSVEKHSLRYTTYLGDGDTKSNQQHQ